MCDSDEYGSDETSRPTDNKADLCQNKVYNGARPKTQTAHINHSNPTSNKEKHKRRRNKGGKDGYVSYMLAVEDNEVTIGEKGRQDVSNNQTKYAVQSGGEVEGRRSKRTMIHHVENVVGYREDGEEQLSKQTREYHQGSKARMKTGRGYHGNKKSSGENRINKEPEQEHWLRNKSSEDRQIQKPRKYLNKGGGKGKLTSLSEEDQGARPFQKPSVKGQVKKLNKHSSEGDEEHRFGKRSSGEAQESRTSKTSGVDGREDTHSKRKIIGFPFLKNLMGKDASFIVTELTKTLPSLKDCIIRTTKEEDFLKVFLQVLAEAFVSRSTPLLIIRLFDTLNETGFFDTLMKFLVDLLIKANTITVDDKDVKPALRNILSILMQQTRTKPSSLGEILRIHILLGQVINELDTRGTIDHDILTEYHHLTEQKNMIEEQMRQSVQTNNSQPIDDFRDYPVYPTPEEITGAVKPFLRPNKVEGQYDDLDHYLDIQYRLLREDFVGPLRDGMKEYINIMTVPKSGKNGRASKNLRNLDIKVYENVRVHSPVVTQKGLCYKLQLEMTEYLQRVRWKFSKRLIYGSMVCLTDKDFNDFFLATVVEREEKDIKDGFFIVHFEQEDLAIHQILHKMFRMTETSGYFESYRHVLTGLQSFKEDDLPFKENILGSKKEIASPAYLTPGKTYDLRPLVDQNIQLQADRRLSPCVIGKTVKGKSDLLFSLESKVAEAVPVLNHEKWPAKEILHMDKSQYKAVQTALANELAIIQGPPGTGKTYIGLQIVKALLHNKSAWAGSAASNRPMLIVCYTNHALDQFLEGVAKFFKGDVLRVGGRSSSEYLQQFNLRKYRDVHHGRNTTLGKLQYRKRQAKHDLETLSKEVQRLATSIQTYRTEIIKEHVLLPVMGPRLYNNLREGFRGKKDRDNFSLIVKWLGISYIKSECIKQAHDEDVGIRTKYVKVEDDATRKLRERMIDTEENQNITADKQFMLHTLRQKEVAFYVQIRSDANRGTCNEETSTKKYLKLFKSTIVRKISDEDIMSPEEADTITELWKLKHQTKWRLYRLWINKLCSKIHDTIEGKRVDFEEASERYQEALEQEDKEIMRQASVIGMTTSGAARYQSVLRDIAPRIIVIEEAAEVLEAHIITTLSKGCEHLILIGDHKQLRPNPTVYKLAVKYNLDISLFERMVKNKMKFDCLEQQHRMRPEISNVMRHIYPHLKDHDHVKSYPNIKGISTNMFLVNHAHLESSAQDIKSYSNKKEAEYAVALCRYLQLQGYGNHEITILTTYTGQLMCIRNLMPKDKFDGVKLTVVDNYQGEENEIVILSLVRSNTIGKIGFLSTENRICVALSRAKVGFYVLGNFDHLAAYSSLWKNISDDMKETERFGEGLKLYCQNHPKDAVFVAKSQEDFKKAPEGGCTKKCEARLKCGHKCERYCHVVDQKHETNKCQKACTKTLCKLEHKCPDKCSMKCQPCRELVQKQIPKCGHLQYVPCSKKPEDFCCKEPCEKMLNCGHCCQNICGDTHTSKCLQKIDYTWPCGHSATISCWEAESTLCPEPCGTILKCDHLCLGTCGLCFNGQVHQPCRNLCTRILICGHQCKNYCENCPSCNELCRNRCVHSVCQKRCGEQCTRCKEPCSWKCSHYKCTKLCSEPCNRLRCNKACKKSLKCNHDCIGLCGEPCPTLCRICDEEKVKEIVFGNEDEPNARFVLLEDCGHIVESKAMDKYMMEANEHDNIQLKCCPLCKTPIRKCLRYGNVINRTLADIERVKKDIIGNYRYFDTVKQEVDKLATKSVMDSRIYRNIETKLIKTDEAKTLYPCHYYNHLCKEVFGRRLDELKKSRFYTERQLLTIQNQYRIAQALIDVRQKIRESGGGIKISQPQAEQRSVLFLQDLLPEIMRPRYFLTEQEIDDFTQEIERGRCYAKLLKFRTALQTTGEVGKAKSDVQKIESLVLDGGKFTLEKKTEIDACFERISVLVKIKGLGITEDERLEIVKAMGLSKGHWFKCPNKHVYAIGECGGANERGKCPECQADIGGLQHHLTEGNQLAGEMDGAGYAAYSEEANNMANFDLNNVY